MADIIIVGEQIVLDYGSASDSATLTETVRIFVGTNDSFTLSESAGAAVSNSSNDSGTLSESATFSSDGPSSDSGSISETPLISASVSASDASYSFSEGLGAVSLNNNDSGSLSDSSSNSVGAGGNDSAILSESVAIAVSTSDSATLTDSGGFNSQTISSSDSATLTDSGVFTVSILSDDSITLTESSSVAVANTKQDSGSLTETPLISAALSSSDSSTASDSASNAANANSTDSATLSESGSFTSEGPSSDSGSVSEFPLISASVSSTDSAALTESGAIITPSDDSFAFSEASPLISVSVQSTDAFTLTEENLGGIGDDQAIVSESEVITLSESIVLSISVESSDSITATDQIESLAIGVNGVDSATLSESIAPFDFAREDSIAFNESASYSATLGGSDSSTISDNAGFDVSAPSFDSATLGESTLITTSSLSSDSITGSEGVPNVAFSLSDQSTVTDESDLSIAASSVDSATLSEEIESSAIVTNATDSFTLIEENLGDIGDDQAIVSEYELATLSESISLTINVVSTDSAQLSESGSLQAVTGDSGNVGENVNNIAVVPDAESLAVSESTFVNVNLNANDEILLTEESDFVFGNLNEDGGNLSEFPSIVAVLGSDDSGVINEQSPFVELNNGDELVVIDTPSVSVEISSTDSANLSESVVITASFVSQDNAVLSESVFINAEINASDSALFIEENEGNLGDDQAIVSVYQLAQVVENIPNVALNNSDNSTVSESIAIALVGSDSGNLNENVNNVTFLTASDAFLLSEESDFIFTNLNEDEFTLNNEIASILAALIGSDSGTITESLFPIELNNADNITLDEVPSIAAVLNAFDSLGLSQENAFVEVFVNSTDSFVLLEETEGNLGDDLAVVSQYEVAILSEFVSIDVDALTTDSGTLNEDIPEVLITSVFDEFTQTEVTPDHIDVFTTDAFTMIEEDNELDGGDDDTAQVFSSDAFLLDDINPEFIAISEFDDDANYAYRLTVRLSDFSDNIALNNADSATLDSEVSSIDAFIQSSDSFVMTETDNFIDTPNDDVVFTVTTDSASLVEEIPSIDADVDANDSGVFAENELFVELNSSEQFIMTDSPNLTQGDDTAEIESSDSATMSESSSIVNLFSTDSATLSESTFSDVVVNSNDSVAFNEIDSRIEGDDRAFVDGFDSATLFDQNDFINPQQTDSATLSEFVYIEVSGVEDVARLYEETLVSLTGPQDSFTLDSENSSIHAEVTQTDSAIIEEVYRFVNAVGNIYDSATLDDPSTAIIKDGEDGSIHVDGFTRDLPPYLLTEGIPNIALKSIDEFLLTEVDMADEDTGSSIDVFIQEIFYLKEKTGMWKRPSVIIDEGAGAGGTALIK
jgi:hypothetical protein